MASTAALDYGFLRDLVFRVTQNVLDPARDYLFESRLLRLARSRGMTCMEELIEQLRKTRDSALEHAVAEAMTINETSFFRDRRPFDLFRAALLPGLIAARQETRTLRLWSAGCSTGQEAYSLAMVLCDHFPPLASWKLRIEGTDISAAAVETARCGRYHRIEINRGLPAGKLARYFEHSGDGWTARPQIRRLCNFRQGNLCKQALPFHERFDVIFLRNVMLYFSHETRREVMGSVHRLLAPDGVLFLGSAEQPSDHSLWTTVLEGGTCYYRPR